MIETKRDLGDVHEHIQVLISIRVSNIISNREIIVQWEVVIQSAGLFGHSIDEGLAIWTSVLSLEDWGFRLVGESFGTN